MQLRIAWLMVTMLLVCSFAAKKKDKDDFTQTLALPKDPPSVAVGEVRRLTFQVSPLSSKGLLSQQVRDALKAILKENGNSAIVHLRAFVAGSGDIRRVPQIVSDVLSEKHISLPSVSVMLAGALPLEGAQVVLEAVSMAKKDVNPEGVEFLAAQPEPDLAREVDSLAARLGSSPALRVTCFVSALGGGAVINERFPGAAVDLVQPQRLATHPFAQCEAVARSPKGTGASLAFTGTRVAFGGQEKDAKLAWQRLDRDVAEAGPAATIVYSRIYELSPPVADMARKLRESSPAILTIPVEGLASVDAGFAVDAVAVLNK